MSLRDKVQEAIDSRVGPGVWNIVELAPDTIVPRRLKDENGKPIGNDPYRAKVTMANVVRYGKSQASRVHHLPQLTYGQRHISCFGRTPDGEFVQPQCHNATASEGHPGLRICAACGCGDKPLDGPRGKLHLPYLECPLARPGFSNAPEKGDDMADMVIQVGHGGAGDAVLAAWYWAGGLSLDPQIRIGLWGPIYEDLLSVFQIEMWPQPEGVVWGGGRHGVFPGYAAELRIAGRKPRHEVWSHHLPIPVPALRPEYHPRDEDTEWAAERLEPGAVLLFPNASKRAKTWPMAYWIELRRLLVAAGLPVRVVTRRPGEALPELEDITGEPWSRVAALIARSGVVVCNVSGPMMLAGTLDRPTLALEGPVRVDCCAANMPSVHRIGADDVECVGCHFSPARGFRREVCRAGCEALMMLRPRVVADRVRALHETGSACHSA